MVEYNQKDAINKNQNSYFGVSVEEKLSREQEQEIREKAEGNYLEFWRHSDRKLVRELVRRLSSGNLLQLSIRSGRRDYNKCLYYVYKTRYSLHENNISMYDDKEGHVEIKETFDIFLSSYNSRADNLRIGIGTKHLENDNGINNKESIPSHCYAFEDPIGSYYSNYTELLGDDKFKPKDEMVRLYGLRIVPDTVLDEVLEVDSKKVTSVLL